MPSVLNNWRYTPTRPKTQIAFQRFEKSFSWVRTWSSHTGGCFPRPEQWNQCPIPPMKEKVISSPSRSREVILQDLARFLQKRVILQDLARWRLSCKILQDGGYLARILKEGGYLARILQESCKITIPKFLSKKHKKNNRN